MFVSGPFLFTHRLIEPLQAAGSARVVYVYSLAELSAKLDFNNLTGDGCRSDLAMYASSKVAILLQVQEMQRRFGGMYLAQRSRLYYVAASTNIVHPVACRERRRFFRCTAGPDTLYVSAAT